MRTMSMRTSKVVSEDTREGTGESATGRGSPRKNRDAGSLGASVDVDVDEMRDLSWQVDANCVGVDPDIFFPERGASTKEAKSICTACRVRENCLEYALDNGEKFGIWGGTSERERRRLRRARAAARQAKVAV